MPTSVATAQKLIYAYIAIAVIQTIIAFVAADALIDAYAESEGIQDLPEDLANANAPAYGTIALFSLVIVGGLLLASALNFPKRAGWARIVALVFGVLGVLGGLLTLIQPAPIWYKLIQILAGLIALGIVVTLLQGESNRWFSKRPQY